MLRKTLDTAKEVISLWQLEIQHNLQTIAELDTGMFIEWNKHEWNMKKELKNWILTNIFRLGSTLPSTMISKETEQSKPDSNVVAVRKNDKKKTDK